MSDKLDIPRGAQEYIDSLKENYDIESAPVYAKGSVRDLALEVIKLARSQETCIQDIMSDTLSSNILVMHDNGINPIQMRSVIRNLLSIHRELILIALDEKGYKKYEKQS